MTSIWNRVMPSDSEKRAQIRALLDMAWSVEQARIEYRKTDSGLSKKALAKAEKEFDQLLEEIEGHGVSQR